jgi:Tfp pilus assembly ATPase PilU
MTALASRIEGESVVLGSEPDIQVKPQIGLDFPNALRSIVRQDPDVIMVGEMRDRNAVYA